MVKVQQVFMPAIWTVFLVLYLYDFLTIILKYSNTNFHMHIKPTEFSFMYFSFLHISKHLFYITNKVMCHFLSCLESYYTSILDCCHIIQVLSCSFIAGSYSPIQRYCIAIHMIFPINS